MVAERKNILMKVMSVFMALVMCFTFVVPVIAATSKTVNVSSTSKQKYVYIRTGKGLAYSLGIKSTTVTVKNTGKNKVMLYKNLGKAGMVCEGTLAPGQTKSYKASGSDKTYYVMVQYQGKPSSVTVSTNAGSVY